MTFTVLAVPAVQPDPVATLSLLFATTPEAVSRTNSMHEIHLCIHIGTIHVDLATMLMNDIADLVNSCLVHTVCGRVGHHECCQAALRHTMSVPLRVVHS